MTEITVRKIRFRFDEPIDFGISDDQLSRVLPSLGLSMTMPYLEPYLIRTMKVAIREITDPTLAEDVRRFCQQEGHHFRNHAVFNDQIRKQFDPATADRLRGIEGDLESDYQRFSRGKSLRWNVAYAEGFEAMTCAGALSAAEHGSFDDASTFPGGEIWAWHMAEEIEHRTVAFSVFDHLVGSYFYRIVFGTRAQWHYISYIRRFTSCMAKALGRKLVAPGDEMQRTARRNYLRTWSPWYDPARIAVPDSVDALLTRYSAMSQTSEVAQ